MNTSYTGVKKNILSLYFILEGILFFLIKWAEYTRSIHTGEIMYSAIILNSLMVLLFFKWKKGDHRIPLALLVTLVADYILTYRNYHFFAGVGVFILVQIIYGWRIGYSRRNVGLRIFFSFLFMGMMRLLGANMTFSFMCSISIAILMGNVFCSWYEWRVDPRKNPMIFALGLTFFAGCDLSLGLRIISSAYPDLILFHDIMNYLTWTCYIPAQVLLTCTYIFYDRDRI